jgi:hypothetical protein
MAMTPRRKLEIQFTKALRRGFVNNAQLYPQAPEVVVQYVEDAEPVIVRINVTTGRYYWFTDRRMLLQIGSSVCQLFLYDGVKRVHWIRKEPFRLPRSLDPPESVEQILKMKTGHYDRLIVEMEQSEIALEGLAQAYIPTLSFLQWLIRS